MKTAKKRIPKLFAGFLRLEFLLLITLTGYCLAQFTHFILASTAEFHSMPRKAMLGDGASVRVVGRTNSSINLTDGRDVITSFAGPPKPVKALEQNQAEPLSLASADFDEDGVPDLISGYSYAGSGIVAIFKGNIDSIYPNGVEAEKHKASGDFTDSPFLSPARVFQLPQSPDFIATGELDGDRHWDIVAAARGSKNLYLLAGNGRGGFTAPRIINLPGEVTALIAGEMNQHDGLSDVIVGVVEKGEARLLVFEGPEGALNYEPEIIGLPATATSLALGQLDDEGSTDLAVAAGSDLMIAHGRNKNFWSEDKIQPASVSKRHFPFSISSIAVGEFNTNERSDVALMTQDNRLLVLNGGRLKDKKHKAKQTIEDWSVQALAQEGWSSSSKLIEARMSGLATEDLVVIDSANERLQIIGRGGASANSLFQSQTLDVASGPVAVLAKRLNKDSQNDLVILRTSQSAPSVTMTAPEAIITVNSTSDLEARDNVITLREAILLNNGTLSLASLTTAEQAQVSGVPTGSGADEINFNIGPGTPTITVDGLLPDVTHAVTIDGNTGGAERIALEKSMAGGSLVSLNIVRSAGDQNACTVRNMVIGGLSTLRQTRIEGNFIGTNANGTAGVDNGGIDSVAGGLIIGGTAPDARNIISGDVFISNQTGTSTIQGNYIGISINENALPNGEVSFAFGSSNGPKINIGGMEPGARNLILNRINFGATTSHPTHVGTIIGNYIGTNAAGTKRLGAGAISLGNASATIDNNVTAGGISLSRGVAAIRGNKIGLDVSGTTSLGNPGNGVTLQGGSGATIIGNVISGNGGDGINIARVEGVTIRDNFIGTDMTGTRPLGNRGHGIAITTDFIQNFAPLSIIERNVISSNNQNGISIGLPTITLDEMGNPIVIIGGTDTVVKNNFIGTDLTGTIDLGNQADGIFINNQSKTNDITENHIAFNKQHGVFIPNQGLGDGAPGFQINISQNSIYSNADLGIDIADPGSTQNDIQDPDGGANTAQNFPVLTKAVSDGSSIDIKGNLNSTPGATFTIEFFSNSPVSAFAAALDGCSPQGQNFITSITVSTDPQGNAPINITLPSSVPGGFINCTATSASSNIGFGNTSEFSPCAQIETAGLSVKSSSPATVRAGDNLACNFTVANSGPDTASNITFTFVVPANTTFQILDAPDGWTKLTPDVGGTGSIISSVSQLPSGTSASFTIAVRVSPAAADGVIITSVATVSSPTFDLNQGDNSTTSITVVTTDAQPPQNGADVLVSLTGSPAIVFADEDITYTTTVTNRGPAAAKDVTVRVAVPVNTTFQSSNQPGGWSHSAPQTGGTGDVIYTNASLAAGSQESFSVIVKAASQIAARTAIICATSVSSSNDTTANNSSSATTIIKGRPQGPTIQTVTVTSQIVATGSGFIKPVKVFIESEASPGSRRGFAKSAKVKGSNKVVQKGKLNDGTKISAMVVTGRIVVITFRNSNGSETRIRFRN